MRISGVHFREMSAPGAALIASLAVHVTVLGSDFCDEDLTHLYDVERSGVWTTLVTPYSAHFTASFGLAVATLHALFGVHALPYYAVVLTTHLANVALLYGIVRAFGRSKALASVTAALWGSAPAFQGTLRWFSAYSHMLGVLATLYALWELARAADRRQPPTSWSLARVSAALIFGCATEASGSITAVGFPVIAALVLPRSSRPLHTALALVPAGLVSLLLFLGVAGGGAHTLGPYFSFGSAIQAFVYLVVYGVGMFVAAPFVTVKADGAAMGVFGGGSQELALRISSYLFLIFFGIVIWRLVRGDWTERRLLLGFLGLAGAVYAAVAIGRCGSVFARSLMSIGIADRYQYDASPGLVIAVALSVSRLPVRLNLPQKPLVAATLVALATGWVGSCFATGQTTTPRRQEWTHDWAELADEAVQLLARRVPVHGFLYVRNDYFRPASILYGMGVPQWNFPGIGAYWITVHGTGSFEGRTIRFVEEDPEVLQGLRLRTRPPVASMFVAPADADTVVHTIVGEAPAGVAEYLAKSVDPAWGATSHDWAIRARRSLQDPRAMAPVSSGLPGFSAPQPAPVELTPDGANGPAQEETKRAIEADSEAREQMRKAIEADPKAREAVRKAIAEDPAAREAVRRELERSGQQ